MQNNTTQHTPGPWKFEGFTIGEWVWGNKIGRNIASMASREYQHEKDEQTANARLIAAAPDLLVALQLASDVLFLSEGFVLESEESAHPDRRKVSPLIAKALRKASEAIAKATGNE